MDDRSLVTGLRSGDADGFAGVYDAYADRLLAYAITLLRDRDAAADAVHDALLIARERIDQLRDPGRFRPWLYAITRNECLRQLRDRRRAAPLEEAGEVIDDSAADLGAGARAAELRELIWSAAAALNPREREVLELSVRHGLEGVDLAAALGTDTNQAHALSSRARAQLERSLGALLVARANPGECPDLDALLLGWDGTLTPLLRKRLARHVDKCEVCGETRRHRLNPVALLAGVPFVLAPPGLRERVLADARLVSYETGPTGNGPTGSDPAGNGPAGSDLTGTAPTGNAPAGSDPTGNGRAAGPHERRVTGALGAAALGAATLGASLAERAGPWLDDGFPRPLDRRAVGRVWLTSAAAVVVVSLALLLGLVLRPDAQPTQLAGTGTGTGTGTSTDAGAGVLPTPAETVDVPGPTTTAGSPTATTTTVATTAPAIDPGTGANPLPVATTRGGVPTPIRTVPTRTIPAPPTTTRATATSPPAPTPKVALSSEELRFDCVKRAFAVVVTATVSGTDASAVTLSWRTARGQQSAPMTGAGDTWTHVLTLPTNESISASATADTSDGAVSSASITLLHNCRA